MHYRKLCPQWCIAEIWAPEMHYRKLCPQWCIAESWAPEMHYRKLGPRDALQKVVPQRCITEMHTSSHHIFSCVGVIFCADFQRYLYNDFQDDTFEIAAISPSAQWFDHVKLTRFAWQAHKLLVRRFPGNVSAHCVRNVRLWWCLCCGPEQTGKQTISRPKLQHYYSNNEMAQGPDILYRYIYSDRLSL